MGNPSPVIAAANDAPLNQQGLEKLLGFHLRMAQVTVWREFGVIFAPMDVTQKQLAVLTLVRDNPGASQIDMAQAIATDRATMMAVVDRLQARGLIERRPSPQDRRRQAIHLTPAGEDFMARADKLVLAHEKQVLSRFTPGEQALLREMLTRLHRP